jgi:hypothetical protein
MPELFDSSTADANYNLFFGPREMHLFNWYNTEMLEMVAKQHLNYWAVEVDESDLLDIYGEAEKKASRDPVLFYAWINLDEPEITTGEFGTNRTRRIEVYAHKDRLTEVGLFPKIGDYLEWDNQFFEIHYADVPVFVQGQPQTKVGVTLRAISVGEDVFNPRNDGTYDDSVDSGSGEPY